VLLKKKTGYRLTNKTVRDIIKSLIAGIILLALLFTAKKLFLWNIYLTLATGLMLTAIVYGIAFKNYYLLYLKRKV